MHPSACVTLPLVEMRSIVISLSVCLSVCFLCHVALSWDEK